MNGNTVESLYTLCASLDKTDGSSFTIEQVQDWVQSRSKADLQNAALVQGPEDNETPLHLLCKHSKCPYDVVSSIITAAPIVPQMIDTKGRTALHYAAANGVETKVLQLLAEAYPLATQTGDYEGVVPLHFAIRSKGPEMTTTCARVLSLGHANLCKDTNLGMLPLHDACAFGASVDVLEILVEAYKEPLELARDKSGMIPLHFVCANPYRPTAPEAAYYILELSPSSINMKDNYGALPLQTLAVKAAFNNELVEEEEKDNPLRILEIYLKSDPQPTADFLTALQSLPNELRDRAVITPSVQDILNRKMAKRIPTFFAIFDFYSYVIIALCLFSSVRCTIDNRMPEVEIEEQSCTLYLTGLFISSFWLLLHEFLQILSLLALGLRTYFSDFSNFLDILTFIMGFIFFTDMIRKEGFIGGTNCTPADTDCVKEKLEQFRVLSSLVLLLFYVSFLSFLKSTFIDFAVFVGGLKNVIKGFIPFVMALVIFLAMFAQSFMFIYFDSDYCTCAKAERNSDIFDECVVKYDDDYDTLNYFCELSLLKVYVMLLGEVNDEEFRVRDDRETSTFIVFAGVLFFVVFMFLVVILLANVLIAIVTDSYGIIKNERASIVFWTNRLEYISECDAIINGIWKKRMLELFGLSETNKAKDENLYETFGSDLWHGLTNPPSDASDLSILNYQLWVYFGIRAITLIIIVCWLLLGFITFGLLWPPQVRERLFFSNVNVGGGEAKELEQRSIEVRQLREEVRDLHTDILQDMSSDRKQVMAMKAQLNDMKTSLRTEMQTVKQVVTMLFDLQSLDS